MTFAELIAEGGPESAARIRPDPPPGSARYRHIAAILQKGKAFVELIDGAIIYKDGDEFRTIDADEALT